MITIYTENHKTISNSKNVRGILHRCSYVFVKSAVIQRKPDNKGELLVTWIDGSYAVAPFESYVVLRDFVTKRAAFKNKIIEV